MNNVSGRKDTGGESEILILQKTEQKNRNRASPNSETYQFP
jgi:hypothetical protein